MLLDLSDCMSFSKESDTVEGYGAVPEGEIEESRPLPAVVAGLHDLDVGVAPRGVVEVRRVRSPKELLPELICAKMKVETLRSEDIC